MSFMETLLKLKSRKTSFANNISFSCDTAVLCAKIENNWILDKLWANEITRDWGLKWLSDRHIILHSPPVLLKEYQCHDVILDTIKATLDSLTVIIGSMDFYLGVLILISAPIWLQITADVHTPPLIKICGGNYWPAIDGRYVIKRSSMGILYDGWISTSKQSWQIWQQTWYKWYQ